jgi:hypothetical protein
MIDAKEGKQNYTSSCSKQQKKIMPLQGTPELHFSNTVKKS